MPAVFSVDSYVHTMLCRTKADTCQSQLARTLISDSAAQATDVKLILADVVQPKSPQGPSTLAIQANLTDPAQADALFNTAFGVPDTVYCLHGIMSRGSEDNFDLGIKVTFWLYCRPYGAHRS